MQAETVLLGGGVEIEQLLPLQLEPCEKGSARAVTI